MTSITKAESEALELLCKGYSMNGVAEKLGVTNSAIKQRLKAARDKLGARTTLQAAVMHTKIKTQGLCKKNQQ